MAEFHTLEIADVSPVTDDATVIAFAVPVELQEAYRFIPGQYLTLKTDINGEEVRRSYSICSTADEGELRVAVKRVPEGRFSNFANERVRAGDKLDVMTPMGKFCAPRNGVSGHNYVGFVGGSGITPFMSIIRTVLAHEPESTFTLFYGNRTIASIMFREELSDLKDRYLDRFRLFHILSDERPDLEMFHGLLDREKVDHLLDNLVDLNASDYFFICGPSPMMDAVRNALDVRGVPQDKQKYELFGSPLPQAGPKAAPKPSDERAEVTVIIHGDRTTFNHPYDGTSVLDGAMARNLDLPYSCKGGVCCTCRAKLIEGEVDMDVSFGLEPDEIENGYILTCQSHPKSKTVVVDYDA